MMEFEQVRRLVEKHREALRTAVGTAEFSRELDNLYRFWEQEEEPSQKRAETLRVLRKYQTSPAVRILLEEAEGVEPVPPPSPAPAKTPSPPLRSEPLPAAVGTAPSPAVPQDTLDAKMVYFRERVTGYIGVAIVSVALLCTLVALIRKEDIFQFLSGLVGVVLGYYFGRAPGEAQAAKAQLEVKGAREKMGQLADEMSGMLESNAGATARSAGGVVMDATQLERMRQRIADMRHAM